MAGLFGGGLASIRRKAAYLAPRIEREEDRMTRAPIVQGTQARTRDQAQQAGLIGGAYKNPAAQGWWAEVMSDPFTALGGRAAFDRKYAAQAAEDEARRMAPQQQWMEQFEQMLPPQQRYAAITAPGDLGRAFAQTAGPQNPTLFNRDFGVVAVSPDGSKSTLVPGTENKGDDWIYDPDYIAGERQIRAASGGGMRQPPSGYTWTEEGALAPIPGGPADPKRSGVDVDPKIIAMENSQSSIWMPIRNDFQRIKSEYGRIKAMGQRKDSVGDLALTVSLTKMLDPGSVARESEVEMTQSAAGAYQQAMMWGPRLVDGKTKLPDNVRKMMVDAAGEMFGVYEGAYDGLARDMQSRLTQYGLSPERVMMGYEAKAPVKPKAVQNPVMQMGIRAYSKQTGIPAEAISEFLSNPATPDEIAQFNEAFGAGVAEALLKALQGGR
jgi:hypothetical protein